ncbi:MAG: hypothetical protein U9R25_08200 [Chloroflexota bacterium]|nr:hypothetical protein [Chloroflexota bacterium]
MNKTGVELIWRPDLEAVVARHRAWFEGKRRYLVTVIPQSWDSFNWDLSIDVKTPRPLDTFDFFDDAQLEEHLSFRLAQYGTFWQTKAEWGLDDDFIPVFEPRIGWAENTAATVAGAEVSFYAQTSAMQPVIERYDTFDWDRIRYDAESPWGQVLTKANSWAARQGRGCFLVQPRALDANPSDFAKACRGNDFFLDLSLHPERVHRLMRRCTDAVIDLIEDQRRVIGGETLGGYATTWHGGYWTPGPVLGHVGDNVSDLISAPMFEQLLAPYLRSFLGHFEGGVFARDVTTKQIWDMLRNLGNVLAFKPRQVGMVRFTAQDIRAIAEATDRLPLFIEPFSWEEFCAYRQAVVDSEVRAFFVVHCQDRDQGARVVDSVRRLETR